MLRCSALIWMTVTVSCGGDANPAPTTGRSLYFSKGCTACHGPEGQGSFMGPSLGEVAAHWTREELVQFIADPTPFVARDARLKKLAGAYRTPMKPSPIGQADRELLADFLLGSP